MTEACNWQAIGQLIDNWQRILLLTHRRPDGDAVGGLIALSSILKKLGKEAVCCLFDPVPARYEFMVKGVSFTQWSDIEQQQIDHEFNGIIVVDTSSWSQLSPAESFLRESSLPRIVIDHHASGDDISGADATCCSCRDEHAAAACQLVYEAASAMGWQMDPVAADALFVGLATDTGWFRFSNADARCYAAASSLIGLGVRPFALFPALYETRAATRIRLKAELLRSLELHADQKIAMMLLTQDMLQATGADASESEDLINEPMTIGSVAVSVLLSEQADGVTRISFRSKPPEVVGQDVDVAAVAQQLGGGGHRRAAGARVTSPLTEARVKVLELLQGVLS
jgi:phosphoesterase RecJ-like protein